MLINVQRTPDAFTYFFRRPSVQSFSRRVSLSRRPSPPPSNPLAVDPAIREGDRQPIAGFRTDNRPRTGRPGRAGSFVGGGPGAPIRFVHGKSVVGYVTRGLMGTAEAGQRVGRQPGIVLSIIKRPDSLIPLRIGG